MCLPHTVNSDQLPGVRDAASTQILRQLHPVLLSDHIPIYVTGDGNCLYRALARGLFGDEGKHLLIRLLVALKMAENRQYYDHVSANYIDLINDDRVEHVSYDNLITSVCSPGAYAEMLMMFAASASLNVALHLQQDCSLDHSPDRFVVVECARSPPLP